MKRQHFFFGFGILLFAVLIAASIFLNKRDVSLGYDFNEPDETIVLPDTLREISGMTIGNDHQIFCVQDENGILFQFDTESQEIVFQQSFGEDGDYEGVCSVGAVFYVLRSDGTLFELEEPMETVEIQSEEDAPGIDRMLVKKYDPDLPVIENEGLFFDKKNNRTSLSVLLNWRCTRLPVTFIFCRRKIVLYLCFHRRARSKLFNDKI